MKIAIYEVGGNGMQGNGNKRFGLQNSETVGTMRRQELSHERVGMNE